MEELKDPEDAGESVNVTVPVGVIAAPELVSTMVTVQVVGAPTGSGNGEHDSEVELLLIVEVIEVVPELVEWIESPG